MALEGCVTGMARIVLPFSASTIGTPAAQYGDREYWSGTGAIRRLIKHFHPAVDLQVAAGLAVRAAADGTVAEASHSRVRGYMIAIDHGDSTGHRFHMLASRGRPPVGTKVRQGEIIGYVADDDEWGSSSNGDHIHFEYRINGAIRGETTARANTPNPLNYLASVAGGSGTPLEDDMAHSDDILEAIQRLSRVIGGTDPGDPPTKDRLFDIVRRTEEHAKNAAERSEWNGKAIGGTNDPSRGDARSVRARLGGIERTVGALEPGKVDVSSLAADLAEQVSGLVGKEQARLVANELAERLKS